MFGDLRQVLARGVDQVSAYPLFSFDHTPAGQPALAAEYARAAQRARTKMQKGISRVCREAGMTRTSVWSFTREGLSPYTTVTRSDYIGFGAGAGSLSQARMSFNTFPVAAYSSGWHRGPALVWSMSPAMARANWFYWAVYTLRLDPENDRTRFDRVLGDDFGKVIRVLTLLGCLRRDGAAWGLTERGVIWAHRIQSLFSLSGIDAVWTRCQAEAWPEEVALFAAPG